MIASKLVGNPFLSYIHIYKVKFLIFYGSVFFTIFFIGWLTYLSISDVKSKVFFNGIIELADFDPCFVWVLNPWKCTQPQNMKKDTPKVVLTYSACKPCLTAFSRKRWVCRSDSSLCWKCVLVYFYALCLTLVLMGGAGQNLSIPILFVKTIEKVIRLCTVLIFFEW